MITTVTVTDALVGTVISPGPDQFITRMVMTQSQQPAWQQENFFVTPYPHGRWTSGRLVLRDQGAGRRVYNFATQRGLFVGSRILLNDASIGFRGDLLLECLPMGQIWEIDFSDAPVVRSQQAA